MKQTKGICSKFVWIGIRSYFYNKIVIAGKLFSSASFIEHKHFQKWSLNIIVNEIINYNTCIDILS